MKGVPFKEGDIIYIHPKTPMTYPRNLPISLPALIRRIPYPVNGYCATRVKGEVIRRAKVILMDIHWFFSLKGARQLIQQIRQINRDAVVVAGGVTATEYPFQLVKHLDVDYVVRGDAEIPLPMLIEALAGNGKLEEVPNIVGKDGFNTLFSVKPYHLTKKDFDENEFFDIDFIPFVRDELKSLHARNPGMPPFIFPFIMPFRGCPINCDFCSGAPGQQKKIFGRRVVVRSPERLYEDFVTIEKIEWVRFFNCLLDFVTLLPEKYPETALKRSFNLKLQYEFTKPPTLEMLQFFLSRFKGGTIHFSVDNMHLTSQDYADASHLIRLIREVQKHPEYVPILDYSSMFTKTNAGYRQTILDVIRHTGCLIYDGSIWWSDFPVPDDKGFADPEKFEYFINDAIDHKHYIAKILNVTINVLDQTLPDRWLIWLRKKYYQYYHRLPFLLEAGEAKPGLIFA